MAMRSHRLHEPIGDIPRRIGRGMVFLYRVTL
jgi:hypothetical protein